MPKKEPWKPEQDESLKKLIRETVKAAGAEDPSVIPHRVRERLKGQATGDLDVDGYVQSVLREQRRKS